MIETSSLRLPDILSFRISSTHPHTVCAAKMLPFPIFLFLLFSATLLAPPPPVLVGYFKITTLQSFGWNTLPTSPDPQTPEPAALISLQIPPVAPDTLLPTQCDPNSMLVANSTVPHSFVPPADFCTASTAVLLVVSLAMLNCLVYKLLVDESNGTHDEGQSEKLTLPPPSTPTPPPSQESTHHHTPAAKEVPHPLLWIDATKPDSESLERESPLHLLKDPSTPSFEITIPCHSPAPLVQSLPFPILSCEFSLDSSEKVTDGDSTPPTLLALDAPLAFVTQSTALEALSTVSVESAVTNDDPDVEPLESNPLDSEAAKETGIPHPIESESTGNGKLQDSMSSPAIEVDCEFDADEEDVFYYQPLKSESDGDETFDYTLEEPTPPPSETEEDQAPPSPHLRPLLGSRGYSLDYAPWLSVKKFVAAECAARYASDDIQVGTKSHNVGETISITRCISADDFSGMFENTTGNAAHDSLTFTTGIPDCHSQILEHDVIDDTTHKRVALLRADAPIFKPRSLGMNEVTSLADLRPPVSVGLKDSIHAPRNDEISETQGCVGVSESTDATKRACAPPTTPDSPEHPIDTGSSQASIDAVEEPESSGSARPTRSTSPGVSGGVYASIHAPSNPSTMAVLALGDNTEKSEKEPIHAMTRSGPTNDGTQSGLYASIHAPTRYPPNESAQRPSKHHTDVPNWAAICKAQNSFSSTSTASGGSFQAQHGNSPDPALDEGALTTTRCAANDQEGDSVDNSDGSLVYVDDQEGTTGSGETDSTLAETDDPNEQDFTKPTRRSRRRGRPRRPRQKVPYVPPPRMRNLPEHPVVAPGQSANYALAAPPASLYYTHAPPPLPHHPISSSGPMIPPNGFNGIMHDQFGWHPQGPQYDYSPHVAPIPVFQPPSHDPRFYPLGPHP